MKELWSDDSSVIEQEIQFLIEENKKLICGRRGPGDIKKLSVKCITKTKNGKLLVIHHPHEPTCDQKACLFYYQKKKNNLRLFECEKEKKVDNFLGLKIPTKIFEIHRRHFQRVDTPNNSTASFSIQNKQRIYNGKVEDISIDGAKLLVDIPSKLAKEDIVTNLTLTLFCCFGSDYEAHLHIPQAKVIWLKCSEGKTNTLGVQFVLKGKDHEKLSDYIELRSLEDSVKNN